MAALGRDACCGSNNVYTHIGQVVRDASLASDANAAAQRCVSVRSMYCTWKHLTRLGKRWYKTYIVISSLHAELESMSLSGCSRPVCVRRNVYDSLPVGSLSRCCLAGGSSVSHGVSWLMGVCPHLTPGASSSPGVWLSPGDKPETCSNDNQHWLEQHTRTEVKKNMQELKAKHLTPLDLSISLWCKLLKTQCQ